MSDEEFTTASEWLARADVSPEIFGLRPDYCAGLMLMREVPSGPSDEASDRLLEAAERHMRDSSDTDAAALQVTAWRDTYRLFGAKPNRTRPSVDALRKRAPKGLPRINRITDIYNAISVLRGVPIGVEDVDAYVGDLRLVRATGDETFETMSDGSPSVETPEPGEPIWRDDRGVTCRRWNWRQTTRTALTETTTNAVFIVDVLGEPAMANDVLDELAAAIGTAPPPERRVITGD